MKVTLKQWLEINKSVDQVRDALKQANETVAKIVFEHHNAGNVEESILMMKLWEQLHEVSLPSGINPQSEWIGGDSSDPKNHKLREPHIVGGCSSKRYFTDEEIAEAEAVCHGPCDWSM